MYILTIDLEEWFHLLDFDATRTENEWKNYEVRIYDNVERIVRILEETDTKATFLVVGWIAKTYPDLVRKVSEKYSVGCHTMNHQLVWQQSPASFRSDVEVGVKLLEDITGKKVECFRAPGFSIRETEPWAFEILADEGIKYDCSVFPGIHSHGGMPSYPKAGPGIISYNGVQMKEFPVGFKTIVGHHFLFSGGGYFRICPYGLLKRWSKESEEYLMAYIHPRDMDAGQPVLSGLPPSRCFKSYVGLKSAEKKFHRWLNDFHFIDVETAASMIDWDSIPIINL